METPLVPDFTPQVKCLAEFRVALLSNGTAQVSGPLDNHKLCMTVCQVILQTSLNAQEKKSGLVLPVAPIRNGGFRNGI